MLKRMIIMLMTGLTLTTAAVSCKGETSTKTTGLVEVHDSMSKELAKIYRYNDDVSVVAYKENGIIVNYYVSCETANGETVAIKHSTEGTEVGRVYGEDWYEAMKKLNPIKP